jgi:primosomal protein N' (replication factor Y) (superfamily II helicase)
MGPCDSAPGRQLREILALAGVRPLFSAGMLDLARWVAEQTVSTLQEAVHCLAPPEIFRRRSLPLGDPVAALREPGGPSARLGPRQARIVETLQARGEVPVEELVREGGRSAFRRLVAQRVVLVKEPPPIPWDGAGGRDEPRFETAAAPEGPMLVWGDPEARRKWIVERAVATAVRGGGVLIIVPEIALVPLMMRGLAPVLGDAVVAFHSGMTARERQAVWMRCVSRGVRVVVGTRSALFAPLVGVRLIAVDDEHDPSHYADAAPRYHARDVAIRRAALEGARAVLGSMTPSMEAYAAVAAGRMGCVRLPATAGRVRVTLVDMRVERARGRRGLLTPALVVAIGRHLRAGGRVVLFVNRTGYARVLLCDECGSTVRCPRCEVTMSFDREGRTVSCRICGRVGPAPGTCPRCGGVGLRGIGPGTERIEEVVHRLFPALRIARLDRETAPQFDRIAGEFAAGRIRLIVGTQILLRAREIRPGLVGVCDADLPLHLPDFRAAERTLQQLRAIVSLAAGGPGAEAIVQTRVPDHPAVRALVTGDDEAAYRDELKIRQELGYPPYTTLARVVAAGATRAGAAAIAAAVAESSRARGVDVLGPAPARDPGGSAAFRYQCVLRAADGAVVRAAARAALACVPLRKGSRITVEMDPQEFR